MEIQLAVGDSCGICSEDLSKLDNIALASDLFLYCAPCITQWLDRHTTSPFTRLAIAPVIHPCVVIERDGNLIASVSRNHPIAPKTNVPVTEARHQTVFRSMNEFVNSAIEEMDAFDTALDTLLDDMTEISNSFDSIIAEAANALEPTRGERALARFDQEQSLGLARVPPPVQQDAPISIIPPVVAVNHTPPSTIRLELLVIACTNDVQKLRRYAELYDLHDYSDTVMAYAELNNHAAVVELISTLPPPRFRHMSRISIDLPTCIQNYRRLFLECGVEESTANASYRRVGEESFVNDVGQWERERCLVVVSLLCFHIPFAPSFEESAIGGARSGRNYASPVYFGLEILQKALTEECEDTLFMGPASVISRYNSFTRQCEHNPWYLVPRPDLFPDRSRHTLIRTYTNDLIQEAEKRRGACFGRYSSVTVLSMSPEMISYLLDKRGVAPARTPSARAKQVVKLRVLEDDWDDFS